MPPEGAPDSAAPAGGTADAPIKAAPLARRMARDLGIDLAAIVGTGPGGRILPEDVEKAAVGAAQSAAAPPPTPAPAPAPPAAAMPVAEQEVVPLTSVRKTIARRLTEAWQAPVFQLGVSAGMPEVLSLRERLVAPHSEGEVKPTVNDVLTKLAAVALTRHPAVNAVFTGDEIRRHRAAHVGIAVAAPSGLVVPVVRDAHGRTIQEIAQARAALVGRARQGKLTRDDLEGGTFTISNLGMFGIERFVAILNPPQVAILAVGAARERLVAVDGALQIVPMVEFVLTCDHRALDGADGAEYLQTLLAFVEQPGLAL